MCGMREAGWRGTGWGNPKPAPGTLALVQDFVNTRNYFRGGDLLGDAEEATARLAERGLMEGAEYIGEAERRRLVEFREGLRELLLAHNGVARGDAGVLNYMISSYMISSAALRVRFRPGGRPDLEPVAEGRLVERIVGRLLAEVVRAEAEGR